MSTLEASPSSGHDADDTHGNDHGDAIFWQVGLILAILTAVEVTTYWWDDWWDIESRVVSPLLIVMMVIKFMLIAMYFMHLKWDQKLLRRLFFGGFLLSMACYAATLSASLFWFDSGNKILNDPPTDKPVPTTVVEG